MPYIIALDQGTTSCRAILYSTAGKEIAVAQQEFTQHFPQPGWVEHDAEEIWQCQQQVLLELISQNDVEAKEILGLGITNQRETVVAWNAETGKTLHRAIVWQDKRTADYCKQLKEQGHETLLSQKTGLRADAYFSASKMNWLLQNSAAVAEAAKAGTLRFGTTDSWLLWQLTKGKVHATDYTNASRTLLFNIDSLNWDDELLELFNVPASALPTVQPSASNFGNWHFKGVDVPICGIAGDQQAALFGQLCLRAGESKNTYGTGCFMLMHTGSERKNSKNGLLTTLAAGKTADPHYALEGSVFVAGAAVQWLRDNLAFFDDSRDSEYLAATADNQESVYVVPAFVGLGAPHWDAAARGSIFGLTRGTGKKEITRATLESIAYQTADVLTAMQADSGVTLKLLRVDGGATANNYLMQFQADILGIGVQRPKNVEATAWGAALLAGWQLGIWSPDQFATEEASESFTPLIDQSKRTQLYAGWQNAVAATKMFSKQR